MRISYLTLALALVTPNIVAAQSTAEITEQSVVETSPVDTQAVEPRAAEIRAVEISAAAPEANVEIAQRGEQSERGDRSNGAGWRGGNPDNVGDGSSDGGWRRRGGDVEGGSAPQQPQAQPEFRPQPRFEQPAEPAVPQFERNRFERGGRDGSTLNTSPPQIPQAQAQDGGGFPGNRDGNRDDAFGRRFGNRGDNGPQIDTTPQRRPEGQVLDQNRDGRFGERGRPDVSRDNRGAHQGGVFTRDWRRDGDRFEGNRDGRFEGNRGGGSGHRFERHNGGWVDRGFGSGNNNWGNNNWGNNNWGNNNWGNNNWGNNNWGNNNWGNNYGNRNWNREWRGDRRYNWQGYRNQYRDNYRQPRYYNPYGYGYGYQRFSIGVYLNSLFFSNRYWINDPYEYRLPAAPYGYRWIRYYDDVLLVDQRNGYVVDVIHNFFW